MAYPSDPAAMNEPRRHSPIGATVDAPSYPPRATIRASQALQLLEGSRLAARWLRDEATLLREGHAPPTRANSGRLSGWERLPDGGSLRATLRVGDTVGCHEGEQLPRRVATDGSRPLSG